MNAPTFAKMLRQNMTDAEKRLWRHLRAHRLGEEKFRRQQTIGPYVADFVHFGARLIVETDGGQHNESTHDAMRDAWLSSQGFRVMRFWNNDVLNDTQAVLEAILHALREPPLPQPLSREGRGEQRTPV